MNIVMKRGFDYFSVVLLALGFLAMVFLATWDRPETTALGGVVLGCGLIAVAVLGLIRKWGSFDLLDLVVLLFVGYVLWRASVSPVAMYARSDQFLMLLAGGIWLLKPMLGGYQALMRKVWVVLMLITLAVNLLASGYQLFVDDYWGLFIRRSETASQYVSGFFSHYNYMANFCMVSALSVIGGVFPFSPRKKWCVLSAIVVLGNLALLVMSHSRGAFVGSAVGIVLFTLLVLLTMRSDNRRSRKSVLLGVGGVSLASVLGALLWMSFLGESRGWFSAGDEIVDNGRGELASLAVDQFLESPWIGDGAHSYEWRSLDLWPDDLWQGTATLDYVHQEYFQLLAEYGLVGIVLCLACLFGFLSCQLYKLSLGVEKESGRMWLMASCATVAAFSVQCFFSFTAHIPALLLSVVFVATIGMSKAIVSKVAMWQVVSRSVLLLAAGGWMCVVSAREIPALVLYTQANETLDVDYEAEPALLHSEITKVAAVVESAPNFQRLERLGLLNAKAYQASIEPAEQQEYLQSSIEAFKGAVELYPMAPVLNLNYGRVLTWDGRHDEAEKYFDVAVKVGERREYLINVHWYYAQACFQRGSELWLQRKTGEAYFYYLKSQRLLEKSHRYRFKSDMPKLLKLRIKLFENAGFVPIDPSDK